MKVQISFLATYMTYHAPLICWACLKEILLYINQVVYYDSSRCIGDPLFKLSQEGFP